ncbi:MAG: hypothetical protein ACP5O3_03680, partial [Candidatus Micrarchaeia archaeon]
MWHHGYINPAEGDNYWWKKLENYIDTSQVVDVKRFFDEHVKEMEEHRVAEGRGFTYFGHANRAYRTPEDVLNAAEKVGLRARRVFYPLADRLETEDGKLKWTEPNPRFVTWHA